MTKSQIKAELRRSACEDEEPYYQCADEPFKVAVGFKDADVWLDDLSESSLRIFYLLVAEDL